MAASNSSSSEFEPRDYQSELIDAAIKENIIVHLGTGTGKTYISIKLIEHLAGEDGIFRPFSKDVKRTFFLVDKVPLVYQQADAIRKTQTALRVKEFCGEMDVDSWSRECWESHFKENHVLVMTAQIYCDCIEDGTFKLNEANLLVFDECHHAKKEHPFKKIMDCFTNDQDYEKQDLPRILGLTASVVGGNVKPGQVKGKIEMLERTLRSVCKTAQSDTLKKCGAKPEEIMRPYLSSNHLDSAAIVLEKAFHSVLNSVKAFFEDMSEVNCSEEVIKNELKVSKDAVCGCLALLDEIGIWAAYEMSMVLIENLEKRIKRVCEKIASLLLQTTVTSLRELCWRYDKFSTANMAGQERIQQEYLKPKVQELLNLFSEYKGDKSKMCSIVFVQTRYAAYMISKLINAVASSESDEYRHLSSDFVTGHGSELPGVSATQMNFKKQQETLTKFRTGTFNVLVGTSVVEEGVDIPKCNLVVMFDFPQNYRAFVQSRGRGRAKDAKYVMLVEENGSQRQKQDQKMSNYKCVEERLRELCEAKRDGPTEEEINEEVNEYPLEKYFTKEGGKLYMGNAVNRLYRYCSKLSASIPLKPVFIINDVAEKFQCSLKLPRNSDIIEVIEGEPMKNKKNARRAVAQEACIQLHRLGALNDHFLPVESSSESESDEDDVVDGSSQHKTGTKKRVRLHRVKTSNQLYGHVVTNNKMNIYAINMEFCEVYDTIKKERLWDWNRKNGIGISLGIVTIEKLPVDQLLPFYLYNDIGKLVVTLSERCQLKRTLFQKHQDTFNWFHKFIFAETLEFKLGAFTNYGCRIVLLNRDDVSASSSVINFDAMETLRENATKSDGPLTCDTDLLDSVVIKGYSKNEMENQERYLILSKTDKTPLSPFPDLKFKTFQDYYKRKYDIEISDLSQSLVEVIRSRREIDCRKKRQVLSGKNTKKKNIKEFLVPELLKLRPIPQSLTLRALFLPTILYRVDSLVSMIELRDTISTEMAANFSYVDHTAEPPRKRSKLDCLGVDIGSEERDPYSSLVKYFSPFERDSSVPLPQLLEAVTCARSNDDFSLERLEMLGDSFLKMAVSIHVYSHENHKDEGKLTKYRTRQISNKKLFKLAKKKHLPKFIKYIGFSKETWHPPGFATSKEELINGSSSSSTDDGANGDSTNVIDDTLTQTIPDKSVADSMEALIGAYFIHCGYMGALRFMTWLGVKVFYEKNTPAELLNDNGRRKSPTLCDISKYANYPLPDLEISADVDKVDSWTEGMALFERKIGYTFKNKVLLLEAFTHPSFSGNTITGSYQRLEFLGDAILDFLVTQHIYNNCKKDLTPGQLTDLRSALVNNNIFAVISIENDYHEYIKYLSFHLFGTIGNFVREAKLYQERLGDKVSPDPYVIAVQSGSSDVECIEAPKPLGDVFESVAGAIFLDSGLDVLEVWRVCYPMLKKFIDEYSKNVPKNPVRRVNELDVSAEYSPAKILEDGRVSSVLKFKGSEYKGFGINKRNAKLSASYMALKTIDDKK